ncbi:MAG: glycosyltransferase family 9 protein [Pseudomonadota bacterium]
MNSAPFLFDAAPENASQHRSLVVTLSNIGDVILTTPVLESISAREPLSTIDILGDRRSLEVLTGLEYRGDLFVKDKAATTLSQLKLIGELRRRRYRYIVDLRTPLLPYFLRADTRVAKRVREARGPHAVESHFAALDELFGRDTAIPPCRVAPRVQDQQEAMRLAPIDGLRVVLAPGGNWPGKLWPAAHYRSLVAELRSRAQQIILLGSQADQVISAEVASGAADILDLCGQTGLLTAAAILSHASLFIGNDSGLGHLAAAVGVPTLTLFGPGEPHRYRPWNPHGVVLNAPGERLEDLEVQAVMATIIELLART